VAEGFGDVGVACEAECADGEVAAGGEGAGAVAGEGLGSVFVPGDVADVVDAVLDAPVAADEVVHLGWAGLVGGEAGEVVGGFGGDRLVVEGAAFAVDPNDLGGVGEQAFGCWCGGGSTPVDAAVATVGRFVLRGKRTLRGGP
jgi:hypothetical protein